MVLAFSSVFPDREPSGRFSGLLSQPFLMRGLLIWRAFTAIDRRSDNNMVRAKVLFSLSLSGFFLLPLPLSLLVERLSLSLIWAFVLFCVFFFWSAASPLYPRSHC